MWTSAIRDLCARAVGNTEPEPAPETVKTAEAVETDALIAQLDAAMSTSSARSEKVGKIALAKLIAAAEIIG